MCRHPTSDIATCTKSGMSKVAVTDCGEMQKTSQHILCPLLYLHLPQHQLILHTTPSQPAFRRPQSEHTPPPPPQHPTPILKMRILLLPLLTLLFLAAAAPLDPETSSSETSTNPAHQLLARNACSGGVNVCCGSASVSCSGQYCKACCGKRCGCFRYRGSSCGSDFPCVDV